jgi:hypothetical protein
MDPEFQRLVDAAAEVAENAGGKPPGPRSRGRGPVSRYGRGFVWGAHEKATLQVSAATLQFSSTSI